jgi:DDE superfamily endonuclease
MMTGTQTRFCRSNKDQSCLVHHQSIVLSLLLHNWRKPNALRSNITHRMPTSNAHNWPYSSTRNLHGITPHWQRHSASIPNGCRSGVSGGPRVVSLLRIRRGVDANLFFPPLERTLVKSLACDLPRTNKQPLARYSLSDLVRRVEADASVRNMSRSTIWRILSTDAIKPWQHRCWIFPRDPCFVEKARVVLDLYAGFWQGKALSTSDQVISADEKTSIQARLRLHPTLPPAAGRALRYEHGYKRGGALQYLAAWDVRRGMPIGRCEATTGIEPFHRLVDQVMMREPYRSAQRVFWIVDGGSSHRGEAFASRLQSWYENAIAVPLPVHASWLNQIEIYFSIIQRKVLTPNDFINLDEVSHRLLEFESYYVQVAKPFDWQFTTKDLEEWYERLQNWQPLKRAA